MLHCRKRNVEISTVWLVDSRVVIVLATMLLLPKDEEAQQMIEWLKSNMGAIQNQIIAKSLELTKLEGE